MISKSLSTVLALDKYSGTVKAPTLLLEKRNGDIIGQLEYTNWNFSFIGNGVDELSFDVHRPADITSDMDEEEVLILEEKHRIWNNLVDLKLVEIKDFARYEISVSYSDSTETIKSVHGQSLEVELAQLMLRSMYVNEQDYITSDINEYNKEDYDESGNFIPTVFYNPSDMKHSLLHRVLADKAPHWSIGTVTPYVVQEEGGKPESVATFTRTYTADGTTIYDFLTGEVAQETNVVFVFDTLNRVINCYSLYDCIDPETNKNVGITVGEDTMVFISKNKLAQDISIDSDVDSVKNFVKIEGGDDIISSYIKSVNVSGDYICSFSETQLNDMSEHLRNAIKERDEKIEEASPKFEEKYLELCVQTNYKYYYESSMMPGVVIDKETGDIQDSSLLKDNSSAKEQFKNLMDEINNTTIAVKNLGTYSNESYIGISNAVEEYVQIFVDSRYIVEIAENSTSYDNSKHVWTGKFIIKRRSNEDEYYPNGKEDSDKIVTLAVSEDELTFAEQKLDKKLKSGDILDVKLFTDTSIKKDDGSIDEEKVRKYFNFTEETKDGKTFLKDGQALARLKSIVDSYETCVSTLASMDFGKDENKYKKNSDGTYTKEYTDEYIFYLNYVIVRNIAKEVQTERENQIANVESEIKKIKNEMDTISDSLDIETFLNDYEETHSSEGAKGLYAEFCSFLREDTYTNSNYISDGLSDKECMEKARKLVEVAKKELAKSCMLQRTVSTTLYNLFALPEFEGFYDKFALFNYIRLKTSDEILKLRLVQIDYNGESVSDIGVTFSDQIESVNGSISDIKSILEQASSMATQFSATVRQAEQGSKANSTFNEIYTEGLNAANVLLKNSNDNEVTFGEYGLLCKNLGDDGKFEDKQLRIIGNGMYLTDDAWKSVKMAVGESEYNGEKKYGVWADLLVGKMIAGENLVIENGDSSVRIDENGITMKNGVIQSHNYNKENATGSILNLKDGTFSFGDESFVWDGNKLNISGSGKFTGDVYANYLEATTGGKIGPWTISSSGLTYHDKTDPDHILMYLGGGYNDTAAISINDNTFFINYDGYIQAQEGSIGPWTFNNSSIYKGSGNYASEDAMYFGDNGLSISDKFKVDENGYLTLKTNTIFGEYTLSTEDTGLVLKKAAFGEIPENIIIGQRQFGMGDTFALYSDYIVCKQIGQGGQSHLDFDSGTLYIDNIYVNNIMKSQCSIFVSTETSDTITVNVSNLNGAIRLGTSTNRGVYDETNSRWLIYTTAGTGGNIWTSSSLYINSGDNDDASLFGGTTSSNAKRIIRRNENKIKVGNTSEPLVFFSKDYTSGVSLKDTASDERLKKDFSSLDNFEDVYMSLNPVSFKYSYDENEKIHFGIKAQDVCKALNKYDYNENDFSVVSKREVNLELKEAYEKNTGNKMEFDEMYELDYNEFIMLNTHMIQKDIRKTESLEATIQSQQKTIYSLQSELDSMKAQIQELLSRTS